MFLIRIGSSFTNNKFTSFSTAYSSPLLIYDVILFTGRLNARDQQTCGFRREARRPDPNKGNVTRDSKATPSEAGTPPGPPPPIKVPRPPLFKPLMFTVGVGPLNYSTGMRIDSLLGHSDGRLVFAI